MKTLKTTFNTTLNLVSEHSEAIRIVLCLTPIFILCAHLLWGIITGRVDTNNL